jgi:hypothetical protein
MQEKLAKLYTIKKSINRKFNDLFWNWEVIKSAQLRIMTDSRRDMVYWITNRISIDDTIKFLEAEKNSGNKYWNLARFIDKNLNYPR